MTVIDVTEATFEAEVLERSKEVPVVVDFWAEWCGPCRNLGPVLEKEAAAREGDVVLAKIDTDSNQTLSMGFGIQSIPAVKAFKDGRVVAEFVGAQPPANVKAFFDALVPSEADRLAAGGDEASLRRALELDPHRTDAKVALARILLGRGEDAEALALVEGVPGDFAAEGLAARIRLAGDPPAPEVPAAFASWDAGDREAAADALIAAIGATEGDVRDDVRRVVVAILAELGVEHAFARDARRRLADALYA
jgi:putative thioredoxin